MSRWIIKNLTLVFVMTALSLFSKPLAYGVQAIDLLPTCCSSDGKKESQSDTRTDIEKLVVRKRDAVRNHGKRLLHIFPKAIPQFFSLNEEGSIRRPAVRCGSLPTCSGAAVPLRC